MANNDDWQDVNDWEESPSPAPAPKSGLAEWLTRGLKRPPDPRSPNFSAESDAFAKQVVPAVALGGNVPLNVTPLAQLLKGIANKTGLSKLPGAMMEKAVRMKNPVPGAGDRLLDQRLVGTRGMMQGQIAKKLPQAEALVQKEVANIPGQIDSVQVASQLADKLGRRMTPGGKIASGAEDDIATILDRASDVASRGDVAPQEALALARGAERNAYKMAPGEVKPGILPELGSIEGQAYKQQLKDLSPKIAEGLSNEQALILAQKGLKRPPASFGISSDIKNIVASPAALSTGAHAARALGRGTLRTLDPVERALLLKAQSKNAPIEKNATESDDWQEIK